MKRNDITVIIPTYNHAKELQLTLPSYIENKRIKQTLVVLDVGAHMGIYTLLAACQLGSEGKVYAFEPDPRNLPFLEANIKRNGFADRAIVVPKVVSSQTGKTSFYLAESTGISKYIWEKRENQNRNPS